MFSSLSRTNRIYIIAAICAVIYFASGFIPQETTTTSVESHSHRLTKTEAVQVATKWAETKWTTQVTAALPMFQSDTDFESALTRLDAFDTYNKKFKHKYPLEYYEVELQTTKGLYRVHVDYRKANVIGWDRVSNLAVKANIAIAEKTLVDMGYTSFERTNTDESNILTYDLHQSIAGMQMMAKIRTDEIMTTDFKTYFRIPTSEQVWRDQQEQIRTKFQSYATFGSFFLLALSVVLAIYYRKRLHFRRGWLLAGIYFIVQSIAIWNMYPAFRLMLKTEASHLMALSALFTQTVFYLGYAGFVYLAFVVGDGMWRAYKKEDVTYSFNNHPVFTYLLAFGVLGVQTLIYFFGDQFFDVWATNDPWFAMDNMQFPLAIPLSAWAAAIGEEIVYRLFAMMALFQLLRRMMPVRIAMFIAILAASMLWALGHVGYPVYPAISRFVEVTLLGFLFSAIFLRFGLIMAILVHAIIDSLLMGIAMNVVPDATTLLFRFALVVYLYLPLLVAYLIRFNRNRAGEMAKDFTR